ncbi:hypothetical protein AWN76_009755 [Rhodothermaceae bacterium RA]|nr:hypothetical protein AWN76_009755 [Rhodothermaceae bacterium RA]
MNGTRIAFRALLLGGLGTAGLLLTLDAEAPPDWALFLGRMHPLVVHLPIALLVLAAVMEWLGRWPRFEALQAATSFVLGLGALSAVGAVAVGHLLALGGGYDEATLAWHRWSGIAVAVLAGAAWVVRWLNQWAERRRYERLYTVLLAAVVVLVGLAGHYGGTLTHGAGYLTRYMPDPLRRLVGLPPGSEAARPAFANVDEAVIYHDLVQPILERHCVSCHNPGKTKGGLRLDTPEQLLQGGDGGPVLVAGRPDESDLVRRVTLPPTHEDHMPPDGRPPLPLEDVELLRWWIEHGASFEMTVAEAEERSYGVQLVLTRLGAGAEDRPTGVFALDVPPPAPTALATLREQGLVVLPLADEVPFVQVQATNLTGAFDDAMLASLRAVAPQVTWLDLGRTAVTDAGLAVLADLPHLTRLHLERTAVTDAGLAHLRGLAYLEYLNLYGTAVTDASLDVLAGLPALQTVYLWQTRVTPDGVRRLREARPNLEVNLGWQPPDEGAPTPTD